jgi:hypothetical protein
MDRTEVREGSLEQLQWLPRRGLARDGGERRAHREDAAGAER